MIITIVMMVIAVAGASCASRDVDPVPTTDEAWSTLTMTCPASSTPTALRDFVVAANAPSGAGAMKCRSLDALLAAAVISQDIAIGVSAEAQRRGGVAALVTGNANQAIELLSRAATSATTEATVWNDLAIAYLSRAAGPSHADDFAAALEASLHAMELAPESGIFSATSDLARKELGWGDAGPTREQRVQALSLRDASTVTARDEDPDLLAELIERHWLRRWATATQRRAFDDAASIADHARRVADELVDVGGDDSQAALVRELTDGHQAAMAVPWLAYLHAVEAYETTDMVLAEARLQPARDLELAGPSARSRLTLLASAIDRVRGRTADARRHLEVGNDATSSRFPVLNARRHWQLGLLLDESGDVGGALDSYRLAIEGFSQAKEREAQAVVSTLLAATYRDLGDADKAWRYQISANRLLPYCRRLRRQSVATGSSLLATTMGLHRAASDLRKGAILDARAVGDRVGLSFLLVDESSDRHARGDRAGALAALEEVGELSAIIDDDGTRDMLGSLRASTNASLIAESDPAAAQQQLDDAVGLYRRRGADSFLPSLMHRRARLLLALNQGDQAEELLREGLRIAARQEQSADQVTARDLRAARWAIYRDMADLLVSRGDTWNALLMVELARARSNVVLDRSSVATSIPVPTGDTLVVSYAVLNSRIVAWWMSSNEKGAFVVNESPSRIEGLVGKLRSALRNGRMAVTEAHSLFELLLAPIGPGIHNAKTLVISADGALLALPFPMLRDAATASYVVDWAAVVTTPSLALKPIGSERSRRAGEVLVVGDAGRAEVSRVVRALPFSGREAQAVARQYEGAVLVRGMALTRQLLLDRLPRARVFHFAGHAVASITAPELSHLVVAPSDDDAEGMLFASDIEQLRMSADVVVLAGCETLTGQARPGAGMLGLARAFMAAGTRDVVGTHWPIDDRDSTVFFVELHRQLAQGVPTAEALRLTQLRAREMGLSTAVWASAMALSGALR